MRSMMLTWLLLASHNSESKNAAPNALLRVGQNAGVTDQNASAAQIVSATSRDCRVVIPAILYVIARMVHDARMVPVGRANRALTTDARSPNSRLPVRQEMVVA